MKLLHTPGNRLMRRYAAVAAILCWSALGLQLYLILALRHASGQSLSGGVLNFLSFFTILTNTLVALALTLPLSSAGSKAGQFFARPTVNGGIAASIAVVGIAYSLLLRHLWQPQGLALVADTLLHDVMPPVFLLYWWLFVPKGLLHRRDIANWACYPALYLAYALARGALTGLYPYPFINVEQLGYARVFVNAAGILIGFVAIALLLLVLDHRKGKSVLRAL